MSNVKMTAGPGERAVLISVHVEFLETSGKQPFLFAGDTIQSRMQEARSITVPLLGNAEPVAAALRELVDLIRVQIEARYPATELS